MSANMSNPFVNSEESPSLSGPQSLEPQNQFEVTFINNKKYFNCLHPDCGKTFKFYSEIKRHLLIHFHERPFICSFPNCHKAFKRVDALNNHIRTHSKTTPFGCPVDGCGYKSTTKSALRYHILRHNGEKIFACSHEGCQRTFLTCSQPKQHEKTTFYHQREEAELPVKAKDYLIGDGQIYCLEKITLDPNQKLTRDSSIEMTSLNSSKGDTLEQFLSDNPFNDLPQNSIAEANHSASTPIKKPLAKTVQRNDSSDNLELQLGQAVHENFNLKQTLQTALDLLKIYKQKEDIGVDMFLKPSSEIDEEQKKEEQLWTSLYDRLKQSGNKI